MDAERRNEPVARSHVMKPERSPLHLDGRGPMDRDRYGRKRRTGDGQAVLGEHPHIESTLQILSVARECV